MSRWTVELLIIAAAHFLAVIGAAASLDDARTQAHEDLKVLLGPRLPGAKVVAKRDGRVVTVDLDSLRVTEVAEFGPSSKLWGLSTPRWSPDGSRFICSYGGKGYVVSADGSERHQILKGRKLHSPFWWKDRERGELCVVYKDADGKHWYGKDGNAGHTYLWRPSADDTVKLADFPCDGTMAVDGTHIAEAYGGCLIVDIENQKYHVLYSGRQACNSSMSPDNTYRIMHLYLPHGHFGIRDKRDRELWKIPCPPGTQEWQVPNWSTDPDFCTATVKVEEGDYKLTVVRIHDSKVVVLGQLGGNWGESHLWLRQAPIKQNLDQSH